MFFFLAPGAWRVAPLPASAKIFRVLPNQYSLPYLSHDVKVPPQVVQRRQRRKRHFSGLKQVP
jgi:hypothetical protein